MNILEREKDPLKLAAMIAEGEKEIAIAQMQDKMINAFLNGTAPEQVENADLKDQVKTLIQNGTSINQILEQLKPIADNTQFVKNVYTKQKPSVKRVSAKKVKEQKTLNLIERMISRGKKV